MSRYIDAKNLTLIKNLANLISECEVIDIVRCKECKWGDVLDDYESGCCGNKNGLMGYITADDFCSYGERKESE